MLSAWLANNLVLRDEYEWSFVVYVDFLPLTFVLLSFCGIYTSNFNFAVANVCE